MRRSFQLFLLTTPAIAMIAMLNCPAQAAQITYTLTSTGTGTLGGTPFTDAVVTVTLVGNTANVTTVSPFLFNPGSATVDVAGVGTGTLTGIVGIASSFKDLTTFGTSGVVIGHVLNPADPNSFTGILGQFGSELFGYDLKAPFGPDSGEGGPASGSHITPVFPTSVGDLTWAVGQSLRPSTFTAVVATPEPGTLAFLGTGLVLLAGSGLRRLRSRARGYRG